jgi:stage IV sporulation protein FB
MENSEALNNEHENDSGEMQPQLPAFFYPPKPMPEKNPTNVWLKSLSSLALYLVLGFYIFPSFNSLLIITGIVVFHELGHFFAMKYYRYSDLGIFFIPLLGAYVSGTKREVSQKQSAVILLAGPLPGIIVGIILFLLDKNTPGLEFLSMSFGKLSLLFILLNLLNLLPVYPLDGGQLLNRVFLDEEGIWGKIFVFISAAAMCWFVLRGGKLFWPLLIFPAMMLLRLRTDKEFHAVEKKIEADGINLDTSYEDLPDEDYWKIRNHLVQSHHSFKDYQLAPPFEQNEKEEKIMKTVQSLLQRTITQDISIAGKIFILLLCIGCFAAPYFLKMDFSLFGHFGF